MNRRIRLASAVYLVVWVMVGCYFVYRVVQAGYSAIPAVAGAVLLFACVNGSLSYLANSQRSRSHGEKPPPYLQHVFLPGGVPSLDQAAPRFTHLLVGVPAALTGSFLVFCGIALAFNAEWSRISQPILAATLCLSLAAGGLVLLWLAWKLIAFARKAVAGVA